MEEIRKKALAIQKRLFRAVDEDSKSFDAVIKAFRLPRDSEKERLHRVREIQKAYQNATLTPQIGMSTIPSTLGVFQDSHFKGEPECNQ